MAIRNFEAKGFFTYNNIVGNNSQKGLVNMPIITTQIQKAVDVTEVEGTVDGSCEIQILDYIRTKTTWTMTFNVQKLRSDVLAILMGEDWKANPNTEVCNFVQTSVGSGLVVTDSAFTGLSADEVKVTITAGGTWGLPRFLEVITSGSPTVDQVLLDPTGGDLTFHADNAGAPIKYSTVDSVASGWESIGVQASYNEITDLTFCGILCSTEPEIVMVEADLKSNGSFDFTIGGDPGVSLEYRAVAKGANRSPVRMFRKAAL